MVFSSFIGAIIHLPLPLYHHHPILVIIIIIRLCCIVSFTSRSHPNKSKIAAIRHPNICKQSASPPLKPALSPLKLSPWPPQSSTRNATPSTALGFWRPTRTVSLLRMSCSRRRSARRALRRWSTTSRSSPIRRCPKAVACATMTIRSPCKWTVSDGFRSRCTWHECK